jgi:hypothetical protein
VIGLRLHIDQSTSYAKIWEMGFSADYHEFSSWVYAVASANELTWIIFS